MVDGEVPGPEMTPEQRVEAGIADAQFGQAGLGSLGIGERMGTGGGAGGQFMLADLAELDSVLAQWKAERDRIRDDRQAIQKAIDLCNPPAKDMMSIFQADALRKSLTAALEHHDAMFDYAEGYVQSWRRRGKRWPAPSRATPTGCARRMRTEPHAGTIDQCRALRRGGGARGGWLFGFPGGHPDP